MIPDRLKDERLGFILVRAKDKKPLETGWTTKDPYKFSDSRLLAHLRSGGNYGVRGGIGHLIVLDFDDQNTADEIIPRLPPTFTVKSGGKGLPHLYFFCDDCNTTAYMADEGERTLLDIKGTGGQVVGPNSTHESGRKYEVANDRPIATIKRNELDALLFQTLGPSKKKTDNQTSKSQTSPTVQALKSKISITDLMNRYCVDTSKNPTMCPLGHSSVSGQCFSYNEHKNLWYCFHCETGGDIIRLVEEKDSVDFITACRWLAKTFGVQLPDTYKPAPIRLNATNYYENVQRFAEDNPFFYDRTGQFWFWDHKTTCWRMVDDTDLLNAISDNLSIVEDTINMKVRASFLEAFKRVGRKTIPDKTPTQYVQFANEILDVTTGKRIPTSYTFFLTNPIQWKIGNSSATPTIDKLFEAWVGPDRAITLYEIIAYCCTNTYPIHLIFCFIGSGRNGKTQFQKLLYKFFGEQNICSTELDTLIDNRFESFKLYKKLVCLMGETNFGALKKTSLLKKLSGGDLIGFEQKGKKPFDDFNYAKIIINSNSLPTSTDVTEGFYSRWLIIDFPNNFAEGKDIIETVPDSEFENLARKITIILPELLNRGSFTNQGTIEERKARFIGASNPLPQFLDTHCKRGDMTLFMLSDVLYKEYIKYLQANKKRPVSRSEFNKLLNEEGLGPRQSTKVIDGVQVRDYFIDTIELLPKGDA